MTIITRIGTSRLHLRLALLGLLLVAAVVLVLTAGAQAGRRETQVPTTLGFPAWSPDGKHVAWVAATPDNVTETDTDTVWVADSSGRKARPLHSFPDQNYAWVQLAWVTSRSLLAEPEGRLYRLALSGRVRLFTQIHAGEMFSLDPSRRFVADGCPNLLCTGSIQILNLRTGKVRRVGSPAEVNAYPALSPGADRVVYQRYTCDSQAGSCNHYRGIWVAPVDGRGKPHRILRRGNCPLWSPDGRLIVYAEPGALGGIGILHVGGRRRLIASPASCLYPSSRPAFSPDSRFIAYQADPVLHTPGFRLAVVDLSTRRVILRSARGLGQVDGQTWSPDGSKILLVARYREPEGLGCMYVGNVATHRWRLFRPC